MPPKDWEPSEDSLRLAIAGDLVALAQALAERARDGETP